MRSQSKHLHPPGCGVKHRLDNLPQSARLDRLLRQPWIDRHDRGELAEDAKAGGEIDDPTLERLAVVMIADGVDVGEVLEPPPRP